MDNGDKPIPAEAATEVGQEEPNFYNMNGVMEELGALVIGGAAIVLAVGLIAAIVGYFS